MPTRIAHVSGRFVSMVRGFAGCVAAAVAYSLNRLLSHASDVDKSAALTLFELSRVGEGSLQGKPNWTDVRLGGSGRLMLQLCRSHQRSSPVSPFIVS